MCCLTIYKNTEDGYIFTHNRDENIFRPSADNQIITLKINNKTVFMPKDPVSDGTWIASNGEMTAAILNGFKTAHIKAPPYKASRGTIIPFLFTKGTVALFSEQFDPTGFEPFTLLVHHHFEGLFEFGWDNYQLTKTKLDNHKSYIYSSPTLYDDDVISDRKLLFQAYTLHDSNAQDLWDLHIKSGSNFHNYLNVKYNEHIQTVSTSQIVLGTKPTFKYQNHVFNDNFHILTIN